MDFLDIIDYMPENSKIAKRPAPMSRIQQSKIKATQPSIREIAESESAAQRGSLGSNNAISINVIDPIGQK